MIPTPKISAMGGSKMATQSQPATPAFDTATIRVAKPGDAQECGRICYEAFTQINVHHVFPSHFPSPDVPTGLLSMMFAHPGFYAVVAELDGKIVGSNCLDERATIAGIGPTTVDPEVQSRGIGRKLMQAVLDRATKRNSPGVRLVQSAFHSRSLCLYANIGFCIREFMSVMQGSPINRVLDGYSIRAAAHSDIEACNRLCTSVHGHDRGGELLDAINEGNVVVAEHRGRITAYATTIGFFGHAVGETNSDLEALIASASAFSGPGMIVPTRNAGLFRWCLENGFRVVEPMTLMTIGLYNEPTGAYLPSVRY
jgi:GNAT superfamily N-acetyltransferase